MPNRCGGVLSLSDKMGLSLIRPALLRKLGLARSWHWSVCQPTSATMVGFLEWCESLRALSIPPTDTGPAE